MGREYQCQQCRATMVHVALRGRVPLRCVSCRQSRHLETMRWYAAQQRERKTYERESQSAEVLPPRPFFPEEQG
jgi:hypothetical protein